MTMQRHPQAVFLTRATIIWLVLFWAAVAICTAPVLPAERDSESGAPPQFKATILICSMALDHADCQPDTAIDVIDGPQLLDSDLCGFFGQAAVATTALAPRPAEEYAKIICRRAAPKG